MRQRGWRSRWTFIAAATAATVGLGNLWKFAYLAGENGGGNFVLVYLLAVLLLALPLLVAEVILGSRGRANPVRAIQQLSIEASGHSRWQLIAWLGMLAGLLILSYYSVIAGWAIAYIPKFLLSTFSGSDAPAVGGEFTRLLADPWQMMAWQGGFLLLVAVVAGSGIRWGVAVFLRLLLPLIVVILLALVYYAFQVGDGAAALNFLFQRSAEPLTPRQVLVAVGHAFFTLSIGVAVMAAYGAYLPDRRSITLMVSAVCLFDTLIALLAGLAIFPLVFAMNIQPGMGPGLMFVAMPYAFGNMIYGEYVGAAFFLMVALTAVGSGVALLEPMTVWIAQRLRWWRLPSALLAASLVWLLGQLTVLSFNLWSHLSLFRWVEFASTNILLPLTAVLIAIFVGWVMRPAVLRDELYVERLWLFRLWHSLLRYLVIPVIVALFAITIYELTVGPLL